MIEAIHRTNLLAIADAYARATGLSRSTISRKFHGNQAFLDEFRRGECSVTISKFAGMVQAISKAWPPGARWPSTRAVVIPRPRGKSSTSTVKNASAA